MRPRRANNTALAGVGMVLAAAVLWGTTGTAQTMLPATLPPHWVGALRLLAASAFFACYAGWQCGWQALTAEWASISWRWVMVAGASMAAYNLTFFAGVKASSVAVGTAIALGSGPIWAGLMQIGLGAPRRPGGAWRTGTLLAVAGGSWMVLGSARQLQISLAGIGLCLAAGLAYAIYALVSKQLVGRTPAHIVTLCVFSSAAAVATPLALAASGFPSTNLQGWLIVLYLGVAATGIAYLLFTHALSRLSSSTAVSMCLAEPLTAFGLAVVLVGERPPMAAFAGLAVVLMGLGIVVRAELRHPSAGRKRAAIPS